MKGLSKMMTKPANFEWPCWRDISWARRSSRSDSIIKGTWRCTTVRDNDREILAKAKADFEQGIAGVQKALSILSDHNGRRWEECRLEGRGQRFAPGDCRHTF